MLEVILTATFLKVLLMVVTLGSVALAPLVLGVLNSRRENRAFLDRLEDGYYQDIAFPRHLTRTSE